MDDVAGQFLDAIHRLEDVLLRLLDVVRQLHAREERRVEVVVVELVEAEDPLPQLQVADHRRQPGIRLRAFEIQGRAHR